MTDRSPEETLLAFREAVNMDAAALGAWLQTDESRAAGQRPAGGGESTGHASGRRTVELLEKGARGEEHSEEDLAHMRKVVGYVRRHLAQRPAKSDAELEHGRWAASLRNCGHDPMA